MPDIGYYTLPVILSFQGIDKQVNDALGKTLDQTVPKQINKSVNDKISKQIEASTKTVGKKIGTTLNTSINPQQVGKDIGTKLNTGITTGLDPKKVGKEVSTKVAEGIDLKSISKKIEQGLVAVETARKVGKTISDNMAGGIDLKPIGKKIEQGLVAAQNLDAKKLGKTISANMAGGIDVKHVGSVLKDVLKEPLDAGKQAAKDWGKQVGQEILAGNVKQAATDIGDVVQHSTAGLNTLGKVIGVNLDSIEHFGRDTAQTIDHMGDTVQAVVDKARSTGADFYAVVDAAKALGSGDVTSRIQGVSTLLTTADTAAQHLGIDITGITTPIQNFIGTATDVAGLASQVKELKTLVAGAEGAGALTTLGGVAAAAGPVAVTIVGIAEGAAVAIAAKTAYDIATFKPEPGAPGTSPALAPEATIPSIPGLPSTGLPPLVQPSRPTPRGTFVPAPPPPPPPPGRVPATEIPQPGWTKDPKTGYLYTPDGTPVPPTPGEYTQPTPDYWGPGTPAPQVAPVSVPAGPQRVPGLAEATTGVANIHATSANVSIGSANVSGISVSVPSSRFSGEAGHGPGSKSFFQSGGEIPIVAHAGEHMLTADDVTAMGGHANVYQFRRGLHYQDGGAVGNAPVVGELGGVIPGAEILTRAIKQGNVKFNPNIKIDTSMVDTSPHSGISYNLSKWWKQVQQGYWPGQYETGGEIKEIAKDIAIPVAKAAAQGAAQGAAAAGAGPGMPALGGLGGLGGQQQGTDVLQSLLGIGATGVKETLGLGTMFPDPEANPNYRSAMALLGAFMGPLQGAMKGKLGIQQPGWRPGMPVPAPDASGGTLGLPFGLPAIPLPAPSESGPGGPTNVGPGPGGGPTTIDASLNIHGDVGSDKAIRDHQTQIQRGIDRLVPMPTGPN